MSCRHASFWLISGGSMGWCPDCGAIRKMRHVAPTQIEYAWTRWIYPKGQESACRALSAQEGE